MSKKSILKFLFILFFILASFEFLSSQDQEFLYTYYNWKLFFETSDKELSLYYEPSSRAFSSYGYVFVTTKAVLRGKDYMIIRVLLNCAIEEEFKFTYIAQKINDRWIQIDPNKPGIEEAISFYRYPLIRESLKKAVCRNDFLP